MAAGPGALTAGLVACGGLVTLDGRPGCSGSTTVSRASAGYHWARSQRRESSRVYAIVRCGSRQEKASVDDVLTVDRLSGEVGSTVSLPAVLIVDDGNVVSDPDELGRYQVTAEIVGDAVGPKINIIHFRNKTGYKRRIGHRQRYTQIKVTSIATAKQARRSRRGKDQPEGEG